MDWSDEKYVKLFTRRTATWMMWPWQARALLPSLLQVANGAGVIDTGAREPEAALAVLVMLPLDLVQVAVPAMVETGTLMRLPTGFLLVNFTDAQEAVATERAKKKHQREVARDKARELAGASVPQRPSVSLGVPPSLAHPSSPPPQPTTSSPPPPAQAPPKKSKNKKPVVKEAAQPDLPAIPPPPAPPPRAPSWQQALYEDGWVPTRWHYLGEAQLPQDDEALPDPALVNTAVSRMLADVPEERRKGVFLGMAEWFCQQPWGAIDGQTGRRRDPPWPWKMFCAEKVWSQARQAVDAADAAERGYDA